MHAGFISRAIYKLLTFLGFNIIPEKHFGLYNGALELK